MTRAVLILLACTALLLSSCGDQPAPKPGPAKPDQPAKTDTPAKSDAPVKADKPTVPAKPAKPKGPVAHDLAPYGKQPVVEFHTSKGNFEVTLDMEKAPKTVTHILNNCLDGFYEGTVFHRISIGFVAQGGGKVKSKTSGRLVTKRSPRGTVPDELNNGLLHEKGVLSMAKVTGRLATNQFFILYRRDKRLDGKYSVFGRVIKGMDVVEGWQKLKLKPRINKKTGKPDKPQEPYDPPVITKVVVRRAAD